MKIYRESLEDDRKKGKYAGEAKEMSPGNDDCDQRGETPGLRCDDGYVAQNFMKDIGNETSSRDETDGRGASETKRNISGEERWN